MLAVKRIEIVVDALETDAIVNLLEGIGAPGYPVVRAVEGGGDRGRRHGDELTGVMQNSYVLVACAPHLATKIIEAVRPLLKRFGGLCLVSDAHWVIH
jgi:nitrogen regulatory protein PII